MDAEAILGRVEAALCAMVAGQRWLVAMDVVVPAGRLAAELRERGAESCFAIGAHRGTGDLPDPEACEHRILDLPEASSMMASIRDSIRALDHLPAEVVAAVDAWDPERRARVLGDIFAPGRPVAGRPFFAARPPAWQRLEDKVVIDAVWDEAGIERAPMRVVPAEAGALRAAAAALDEGAGTVWAAGFDRDGVFNGGAQGTWWVRDAASEALALEGLAGVAEARVMPFLEGLPCSIHALVLPDHVVTTRPAELLTLRKHGGRGFLYGRAASFWLPERAVVDALRAVAVRVGERVRESVGFRGALTIDGVWTADGFRPTELNPRVGAALALVMRGIDLYLVNAAMVEGVDLGVSAVELEAALRARVEGAGTVSCVSRVHRDDTECHALDWDGARWSFAADPDRSDGELVWGPHAAGSFLRLKVDGSRFPLGPSFAPVAAAFVTWADENLGTGLGPVSPAREPGAPTRPSV